MNNAKFLIIACFISLCLLGCRENSTQIISKVPQSQQTVLLDSLQNLDSLVLKSRTNDVAKAFKYAQQAGKIAQELNTPTARAKSCIMFGNAYSVYKMDSGFYYYNKALLVIDSFNLIDNRGKVLYNLGMLNHSAGNYKTSIILLDSALSSSRSGKDLITESNSLNSLGNIYFDMGDDAQARKMYDSAFRVAKSESLFLQMGTALGSLAKFETDQKKSIELNKQAISYLRRSNGSEEPIALILINIGNIFLNQDSAIYYFKLAINTVSVENAPDVVIGAYNSLAYSYLEKGDLPNAEKCIANQALPISIKTNKLDWQSTVYDTYSDILRKKGAFSSALDYEKKAIETMQIANKQSALKQVKLLAAMLDLKNKESLIKDGKIMLEQTQASLKNRNQFIIIIFLLIAAITGVFIVWVQKKRIHAQKQQIESAKKIIEAEENEKAKIGRDFHDLTGQKFSGFYGHLENVEFPDPETKSLTLIMLQEIREMVREMSHRMNKSWIERFTLEKSLIGLCTDIKRMTQLNLEFNAPDEYPAMTKETKIHVFRIIQELLANSVTHAINSKVILDISFDDSNMMLKYSDNGPGFSMDNISDKGVGLSNIFERVKLLNGNVELDAYPGFGTYFAIRLPLLNKT